MIVYGISGGRVTYRSHIIQLEDQIKNHKPKKLIFHNGGNDLDVVNSDNIRVEEILHHLIALTNYFIQKYSFETVVLPQFMPLEGGNPQLFCFLIQQLGNRGKPTLESRIKSCTPGTILEAERFKRWCTFDLLVPK